MSARTRRRILVAVLIVCTLGTAFNLGLMTTGLSSEWTVILFTVEASGIVSCILQLLSMRGQR